MGNRFDEGQMLLKEKKEARVARVKWANSDGDTGYKFSLIA